MVQLFKAVPLPRFLLGRCDTCRAPRGHHHADCPNRPGNVQVTRG